MTGALPETLLNWKGFNLIEIESDLFLTEQELAEVRVVKALTSSGDTLSEVYTLLNDSWHYRPSGWKMRKKEFLVCLSGDNETLINAFIWQMLTTYTLPELLSSFLLPIERFLVLHTNKRMYESYLASLNKMCGRLSSSATSHRFSVRYSVLEKISIDNVRTLH